MFRLTVNRLFQQFGLSPLTHRLPSQCAVCKSWPAEPVCEPCVARFCSRAQRCSQCAVALPADLSPGQASPRSVCFDCIKQPPPVNQTLVAVDYAYPWSALITQYKFADQPGWAAFFAKLMLANPAIGQVFDSLSPSDVIVPIPLATQRLQTRGFNQAWELATQLAAQSGSQGKTDATLLWRVKNTPPQTQLKRQARMDNVRDAFQIDPLRAASVAGKRVVLVDDVMTSGASLFTAAEVLRAAGAVHITGVVLARTPL